MQNMHSVQLSKSTYLLQSKHCLKVQSFLWDPRDLWTSRNNKIKNQIIYFQRSVVQNMHYGRKGNIERKCRSKQERKPAGQILNSAFPQPVPPCPLLQVPTMASLGLHTGHTWHMPGLGRFFQSKREINASLASLTLKPKSSSAAWKGWNLTPPSTTSALALLMIAIIV